MGLDWNPMARPRKGAELEVARILATDLDALDPAAREAMVARFQAITEPPHETIGAPRVGFDAAADAWLLDQLRENGREAELDRAREEMRGYCVLDLLPESPGLPLYGSFGYEGIDRYTFRGAFLSDVEDLLGEDLYRRAWTRMSAADLEAYGSQLLRVARAYAAQHRLEALEGQRELPGDLDEDEHARRAHILFSAAAWCLWWASRGHGLEPYF